MQRKWNVCDEVSSTCKCSINKYSKQDVLKLHRLEKSVLLAGIFFCRLIKRLLEKVYLAEVEYLCLYNIYKGDRVTLLVFFG